MLSAFPSPRKLACLKVVYRTDYAFDFYGIGNLPDNLIHRLIDHRTLVKRILAYAGGIYNVIMDGMKLSASLSFIPSSISSLSI